MLRSKIHSHHFDCVCENDYDSMTVPLLKCSKLWNMVKGYHTTTFQDTALTVLCVALYVIVCAHFNFINLILQPIHVFTFFFDESLWST